MTVGDRLAELLIKYGVEYVFGVPGGQTLPFYEGIRKTDGRLKHILMRDERSAGFAADAVARLSGKVSVCDATVGPGATNLVSPLAEAFCSSIPMLALISDIPRNWEHLRQRGNASQAIQQLAIFRTISKWQATINDPAAVDDIMDNAMRVATTGKPGPVVVCMPQDIGMADVEPSNTFKTSGDGTFPRFRMAPDPDQIRVACDCLAQAKKPLLLVGGGAHISKAGQQVHSLTENLQIPIITTISGKGIIEETHSHALGVIGHFGNPIAMEMMNQADLVVFIGCKAGQMTTFSYNCPDRGTKAIHLDIDPEEIGRVFQNSIPLVGDVKLGLEALMNEISQHQLPTWAWNLDAIKKDWDAWLSKTTENADSAEGRLRPQAVMAAVNNIITPNDILVCDASLASGWAASILRFNNAGHNFLAPRGLAGLGWGAPAAVGAALAQPDAKRIIHFAGDGGFSYSLQELEVMARLNLPVVTIILNNDILGWIKHIQKDNYQGNYISSDFTHVDFATVAKGFGVKGYTIKALDELDACLNESTEPDGPVVIDILTDQWETPVLNFSPKGGASYGS
ncbi:MAG: thiamine pyrophosphate-binding protein [Thermodesulfobacteriota bacterium]